MAESDFLTESGAIGFLAELVRAEVRFMVVGASAAVLQGVPLVTQDIDLWFAELPDPKLRTVLSKVGGIYVPSVAHNPPTFAGDAVKLFDIVVTCQGLESFDEEYVEALAVDLGPISVPVLPLERVIHSKRAAGRQKDTAALPALETASKTIYEERKPKLWSEIKRK
ncbi:MAG: hypothetical protein ACE361_26335 [Aureliella sp.]